MAATGYEPGAVAPFALRGVETVLIDSSLVGGDVLWVGAGTSRHMAGVPATELVRVARAQPADVRRRRVYHVNTTAERGRRCRSPRRSG